jgi:hypothetical protein
LKEKVAVIAKNDGTSLSQFIAIGVAEKVDKVLRLMTLSIE